MTASPPPPGTPSGPGSEPDAPRTCYRHGDRETGVSCTRCSRPICPDCMVEASVGFQCPECVAEGNRKVRSARTTFGGKVVEKPYVTWTILVMMAVGFLVQTGTSDPVGQAGQSPLVVAFGMHGGAAFFNDEWYRLITAAFLHGGVMHLLFNGYAMYLLGQQLERWLGHGRFLALWVVGALSGSVMSLLFARDQLSVGASGAIFALFGAVFVIGRRLRLDMRMILVLLALNLGITFLVPGISWTAHIGGLVAGLAVGAVFAYLPTGAARGAGSGTGQAKRRTLVHALMVALYVALLAVLVVLAPMVWYALVPA
ncbi:rhomboid family intramembrane serine protease [Nocardiopsis metallicus]|uniref:Membrane associated rhomboid family serine protease n=1 Tax=Nocardiopsis metallicus TaxID=179819 RepID=A0A840WCG7_9ACTN|nr:rhomboid family intramembrane serine protease [Nocardiopsis metallicus]MBB5493862.1 membrane associated rhomboid family serine protease [Nocardiopsis metallicus]